MNKLMLAALLALLGACASIDDSTVMADLSDDEIARRKSHPVEAAVHVSRFTLPVSVEQAYRQFQRGARKCWQVPGGSHVGNSFLEDDAFSQSTGYARLSLRFMNRIRAVVTIRPDGPDRAAIDMRTVFPESYLPNLRGWFDVGSTFPCMPPEMDARPDASRQRY